MPAQIEATVMCNVLIIQEKYNRRPEAGYLLKGEKNAYWNFSPVSDYCFSFFLLILFPKRAGLFGSDWWEGAVFSVLISRGNRRSPDPKEQGAMRRGQACPPSRAAQARRAGIPC